MQKEEELFKKLIEVCKDKPSQVLFGENGVPYIQVEGFGRDGVSYGFSTRLGGVSEDYFASMNLGLRLGDDRDKVLENYERIAFAMGFDKDRISCPYQVHETRVRAVGEADAGSGILREVAPENQNVDAQVTATKNLPLIVYGADCVPMLFHDPVKNVIGSCHGGWRGSVAGIAGKVIDTMVAEFGSNPDDIQVAIGPSAGPESYEVDQAVADEFMKIAPATVQLTDAEHKKYHVNLWGLNQFILEKHGVRPEHIVISGLDTIAHPDLFHSHRVTGGKRGLNAGFVVLV